MSDGFRMVVLGDSVPWGQGLGELDKYHSLVENALAARYPDISSVMLAHSGAVIGVGLNDRKASVHGEVPVPYPTILQQAAGYTHSPESVRLVLVNGGINDIDVRVILNPLISRTFLRDNIRLVCRDDTLELLNQLRAHFTNPNCKILLTGYYPVLSPKSYLPWIPTLLDLHGICTPPFLDQEVVIAEVVRHSMQFWQESSACFQQAVDECNRRAGGAPRVFFLDPGFTEANAAFGPDPWLYGLQLDFTAEDPIAADRHAACDLFVDSTNLLGRESCYRASAGHPNPTGSRVYADAILAKLAELGV